MPSSPAPGDRSDLLEVALRLARVLDGLGLGYAFIGALGDGAWGLVRATQDVEACLALESSGPGRLDAILDRLEGSGFRAGREAVRRRLERDVRIVTVHFGQARVDLFLRRPDGYWDSVLANRARREAFGVTIDVASAGDIIARKLASDRPRDREDADLLAAANRSHLDLVRLRAAVDRLERAGRPGLGDALEALLREGDPAA